MSVDTASAAIQSDAGLTRDDATNAFLKGWEDAAEPSQTPREIPEDSEETEVPEEGIEGEVTGDEEEDQSESDDDSDADPQDDKAKVPADDAKVFVTVDGEQLEVSVKDLKRLYGQEASLTKKSQAVAETQKQLVQTQEYVEGTLELMLAQASEAFEPYKNIDWVVASKRLNEEELLALRDEATKAYKSYETVTNKVQEYTATKQKAHQESVQKLIEQTQAELSDTTKGIPNWGRETHATLSDYAKTLGFPQEAIDTFVTSPVWHLLHKAYQFDKGKQVVTEKVNKTPKQTLKSTQRPQVSQSNQRAKEVLTRMREAGGSRESAQDAFLSMWRK